MFDFRRAETCYSFNKVLNFVSGSGLKSPIRRETIMAAANNCGHAASGTDDVAQPVVV